MVNQEIVDDLVDKIESKGNKVTSLSASSTDVQYPSAKAVYDSLQDLSEAQIDIRSLTYDTITRQQIYFSDYIMKCSMTCNDFTDENKYNNCFVMLDIPNYYGSISNTDYLGIEIQSENLTNPLTCLVNLSLYSDYAKNVIGKGLMFGILTYSPGYRLAYEYDMKCMLISLSGDLPNVAISGSYLDLINKPTIPTNTSDLTNDSGFLTSHQDISGKENTSNKTSSWNSTTNDTRYPTEKLVKDSLDAKQNTLVSGTNIKTINNNTLLGNGNISIPTNIFSLDQTSDYGNTFLQSNTDSNGEGASLMDDSLIYNSANLKWYYNKDGQYDSNAENELATIEDISNESNTQFNNIKPYLSQNIDNIIYDTNNYNGYSNKQCSVVNKVLANSSVSQISLNKEFTLLTKYVLTFDYGTPQSRNGFLYGFDPSIPSGLSLNSSLDNYGVAIVTDVGNTFVETYYDGSTTRLYSHTSDALSSGTHNIKIVRNENIANIYIDDVLIYTHDNVQYNTFGLNKWGGGLNTIRNVKLVKDEIDSLNTSITNINSSISDIEPYVYDTGWKDLTLKSGYSVYDNARPCRYRRIGKVVHLEGIIRNANAVTPNTDGVSVGTITDTSCRPSYYQTQLNQGSGANKFILDVSPNGDVRIARYGTTANNTQITSGSWLQCYITYFVD